MADAATATHKKGHRSKSDLTRKKIPPQKNAHDPVIHPPKPKKAKSDKKKKPPCRFPCFPVPVSVPDPASAQKVLHPRKDVFVLKIARIGAGGDRQSKLELELVTNKRIERRVPGRVDTKGTQFDEPCKCCCCCQC